jgi:molybdate transport system permease protein
MRPEVGSRRHRRLRRPAGDSTGLRVLVLLAGGLMMAGLFLPVVALIWRTLTAAGGRTPGLLTDSVVSAVSLSLSTTLASTLIVVALGTPLAYAFARYRFPLKRPLNVAIELPIVMPPVVAGLALLMTFGRRGLLGPPLSAFGLSLPFSPAAVVIAQVFVSAPFYIRAAQAQFEATPRELEQAASIDGAAPWRVFWSVTLPLSQRGLLAGLLLSWARAVGEFGATILFAGNLQGRTQTMPLLVYGALESDLSSALWTGLLLIAIASLALALVSLLARAFDPEPESDASSQPRLV